MYKLPGYPPNHCPLDLKHMIPQMYQYGDPLSSHDSNITVEHISIRTKSHHGANIECDWCSITTSMSQ